MFTVRIETIKSALDYANRTLSLSLSFYLLFCVCKSAISWVEILMVVINCKDYSCINMKLTKVVFKKKDPLDLLVPLHYIDNFKKQLLYTVIIYRAWFPVQELSSWENWQHYNILIWNVIYGKYFKQIADWSVLNLLDIPPFLRNQNMYCCWVSN